MSILLSETCAVDHPLDILAIETCDLLLVHVLPYRDALVVLQERGALQ